jgi:hypothetical protein
LQRGCDLKGNVDANGMSKGLLLLKRWRSRRHNIRIDAIHKIGYKEGPLICRAGCITAVENVVRYWSRKRLSTATNILVLILVFHLSVKGCTLYTILENVQLTLADDTSSNDPRTPHDSLNRRQSRSPRCHKIARIWPDMVSQRSGIRVPSGSLSYLTMRRTRFKENSEKPTIICHIPYSETAPSDGSDPVMDAIKCDVFNGVFVTLFKWN